MEFFSTIFNAILYKPLFNALILFYEYIPGHDFGIAVILLTILIKVVFYPLGVKAIKSQKALSELQPKMKEIQEKYKKDKEKQAKATMELYKKEKINPLSGCFPLLIQLPVLIALFWIFKDGFQAEQLASSLYAFIPNPEMINPSFLGIIDLSRSYFIEIEEVRHYLWPNIVLIGIVGVVQFFQTKMLSPKTKGKQNKDAGFAGMMQKQMLYFMPIFMVFILSGLPSAVALYWLVTSLFTIGQQYFILGKSKQAINIT